MVAYHGGGGSREAAAKTTCPGGDVADAGGSGDLTCVVGTACDKDVDDVAYTSDLLDVVGAHYTIETRVTVTGLSNGGAMAHRAGPAESTLPADADDGMTSQLRRWERCDGDAVVELITVVGGGHTWPMEHSVAPRIVGPATSDFSGSELVWEFVQSGS